MASVSIPRGERRLAGVRSLPALIASAVFTAAAFIVTLFAALPG